MMNNRGHLPAGQAVQGGMEMGPGPGGGGSGGGGGGGPRRGGRTQPYPAHQHHYHQQHISHQPMQHNSYMAQYGAPPYYSMPTQYQNGGMGSPGFYGYPPVPYSRSPTAMQHYAPMVPPPYSRPPQQSPIVPAQYHAPPHAPIPVPPHTPSSTHSVHAMPPPMTPPTPHMREVPPQIHPQPPPPSQPPAAQTQAAIQPAAEQIEPPSHPPPQPSSQQVASPPKMSARAEPFRPPLPWLSRPDLPFPARPTKSRRRRRALGSGAEGVELPINQQVMVVQDDGHGAAQTEAEQAVKSASTPKQASATESSTVDAPSARPETPSTQEPPSESATSTSPTTPASVQDSQSTTVSAATPTTSAKPAARAAVPALPVLPVLPKASPKDAKSSSNIEKGSADDSQTGRAAPPSDADTGATQANGLGAAEPAGEGAQPAPAPAPVKVAPKLWTGLFAKSSQSSGAGATPPGGQSNMNGGTTGDGSSAADGTQGFSRPNASSLAEALQAYRVGDADRLAFLEPRGLINTGNMCYMNSVLQVLLFCIPFYNCLDQVSKRAAYSFKSETPLLDAMIMFMREFHVIDSATSVEQLRRRLKSEELEQYGEPFIPEFVYDAIRKLPRFASMRRGHQQDAEEFLGFLLEGLHDECAQIMRAASASNDSTTPNSSQATPTLAMSSKSSDAAEPNDVWLEVGPRQRPAITRSSGYSNIASPVTKIFGGQLRSELRVPGLKHSVTLEPYQPLQLDIGAPEVRNIVDALKGLTRSETLHGDFNSPHGKGVTATKQVFIESLPPVLILHLKRFQFDAEGNGTIKIWKKVGYPLELEIPRDVLSRQKRNAILAEGSGLPKYRLTAVVYHHGKNASGGHYTVDVRRQDGLEWIRIDDTVIRRVRSEDVAEGGAEEKATKAPSENRNKDATGPAGQATNRFVGINEEDTGDEEGWKQVSGTVNGNKKWSSVVNSGSSSRSATPKGKPIRDNIKDKIAYLLFYQRI